LLGCHGKKHYIKIKILSLTLLRIWLKKGQSIYQWLIHCLLLLQQGQKLGHIWSIIFAANEIRNIINLI